MSPIQLASMIKMSLLFASFVSIHAGQDENKSIVENNSVQEVRKRLHDYLTIRCHITAQDSSDYVWIKIGTKKNETLTGLRNVEKKNSTYSIIELVFEDLSREDNGTYLCGRNRGANTEAPLAHLIVLEAPTIKIDFVKPLTVEKIYINWTVNDGNDPIKQYTFLYTNVTLLLNWYYFTDILYDGRKSSHVLDTAGMRRGGEYSIKMLAKNSVGESSAAYPKSITALEKDTFPTVFFNKTSKNSMMIHWSSAPGSKDPKSDYVYEISEICGAEITEPLYPNLTGDHTIIDNLQLNTDCRYKVRACSKYDKNLCGNWNVEA